MGQIRKEYLPTLNNRQKWRCTANETLKEGDLVCLVEESHKRGCYNLGRVTKTIDGSDGVIRSAIVQETSSEARPSTTWKRRFHDGKQGQRCGG